MINPTDMELDADISGLTTFRLPARAAALVSWQTADDLTAILADPSIGRPIKAIGGGSNLLFTKEFDGTLLRRSGEPKVEFDGLTLTADCHVELDALCEESARRGLRGMENLSGIPGTLGGALVQNAGAYGAEIGDVVDRVELYDLAARNVIVWTRKDFDYGYRTSELKRHGRRYIALRAWLRLEGPDAPARLDYGNLRQSLGDADPTPMAVRQAVVSVRASKLPDPKKVGSAGSFFRNPEVGAELLRPEMPRFDLGNGLFKVPAAWLIDQCGLKGASVGGASTWPGQPLVIVNTDGHATASDVIALEAKIIAAVRERYGITLIPEVEHV